MAVTALSVDVGAGSAALAKLLAEADELLATMADISAGLAEVKRDMRDLSADIKSIRRTGAAGDGRPRGGRVNEHRIH